MHTRVSKLVQNSVTYFMDGPQGCCVTGTSFNQLHNTSPTCIDSVVTEHVWRWLSLLAFVGCAELSRLRL